MRRARLLTAVAAATALATTAAACASNSTSSKPAVATVAVNSVQAGPPTGWSDGGWKPPVSSLKCSQSSTDPTRGITPTSIKVGGLAYLTSPNGSSMAGADIGAKVRFEAANDAGGINGRTIDFSTGVLDDGQDAARNGSLAKVLVDQDKVFAVVPELTTQADYFDTLCKDAVPFFGWGINAGFCNSYNGFGITGCDLPATKGVPPTNTYGLIMKAIFGNATAGKTVALIGQDDDSSRAGQAGQKQQIEQVGVKVVYAQNPIPLSGLSDTTAIVNAVMTSNAGGPPDLIFPITDFATTLKLTQAFQADGYKGKLLNAVGYDPRLKGFAGLDGSYTLLQFSATEDSSAPGVQKMVADFQKYAPDTPISLTTMAGYWSADMFVTAATKAGRDLNANSFLKMLNSNYSNYVDGALPQTRFPVNHFTTVPCGTIVQLTGKTYMVSSKLFCGALLA
jgi:ABC-type branched-subunit amino acid transport system substrate-binding protein